VAGLFEAWIAEEAIGLNLRGSDEIFEYVLRQFALFCQLLFSAAIFAYVA
jgi:hypothetical protein